MNAKLYLRVAENANIVTGTSEMIVTNQITRFSTYFKNRVIWLVWRHSYDGDIISNAQV
jgi:hypothetical protein